MWTKKQKKASGLFFLFVGLFLLVCNAITPLFYRAMPNDYVRTKLILSTLSDILACPEFVIFGNKMLINLIEIEITFNRSRKGVTSCHDIGRISENDALLEVVFPNHQ